MNFVYKGHGWFSIKENLIKLLTLFHTDTKLVYVHACFDIPNILFYHDYLFPKFYSISNKLTGTSTVPMSNETDKGYNFEEFLSKTYTTKTFLENEVFNSPLFQRNDRRIRVYINLEMIDKGILIITS